MFDKDHEGLNAKKGLLIFFVCLMLAATVLITNYLPYRTQADFEAGCTSKTEAKVFAVEDPILDGNMYFGPMIEYFNNEKGQYVHSQAASAVKRSMNYEVGDKVEIAFNPNSPGDLYLTEDTVARDRWRTAFGFGIGIAVFGLVMLVIGCVRSIMGTDKDLNARKFLKNPDGQTYNEWLESQQKKNAELTDKAAESEEAAETAE